MSVYVMMDLETMGTRKDAAITALGATAYCAKRKTIVGENFYKVISLESSVNDLGLKMDASTVLWWMNQSPSARAIYSPTSQKWANSITGVLTEFARWVKNLKTESKGDDVILLGNGSTFDNVILRTAFEKTMDIPYPVSFRDDLCYRTLNHFFKGKVEWQSREGTHHNALDDAKTQMNHFIRILNYMENMGN